MNPQRWEIVKRIFAAVEPLPPPERDSHLRAACAQDDELRGEVESLLAALDGSLRTNECATNFTTGSARLAEGVGTTIHSYRLSRLIGEGGMGEVWMADQSHPIRRTVALKLIKLGMDSRAVIARFESERQALALMNHPNVARVLDAGTSDTGRPYFVMEYVAGEPITSFCDRHHYTTRQRLELFCQTCEAVQHAHQKALIHRDLKPSNILVTLIDFRPTVKVIDFGVAKATAQKLTDRTLFTETGTLVGTPEYMSPEQAEAGDLDIDTRADVYSLGVVLYELLSGALPFEPKRLRTAGFSEIQRILREVDPPRPSTRLSSLGEAAGEVARKRQTNHGDLARQLRTELEWIPLKAMRKDRSHRYASAEQLAQDVRNYLDGKPLLAGPESRAYRVRKFLRRNDRGVAASAAMVLLLASGLVIYVYNIRAEQRRTDEQRRRAEAALIDAKVNEKRAQEERDNAQATLAFLTNDVLAGATPDRIPDVKVRDQIVKAMVEPAAERVGEAFADRPLIEAGIRDAIQKVLLQLGRADLALPHAEQALSIRRRLQGEDHVETLTSLSNYAGILKTAGRLAEAEPLCAQALERSARVFGEDHPQTIHALNNYASVLNAQGRSEQAAPLFERVLRSFQRVRGPDHPDTLVAMNNYAFGLNAIGRSSEAEPIFAKVLEVRRRSLGEDDPHTITSLNNYALAVGSLGRTREAELLRKEVLERRRRVLGEDHPHSIAALNNYGLSVGATPDRLGEAEPLFREAWERSRRVLGADHPDALRSLSSYAGVLIALGRPADAEPLAREAVDLSTRSANYGPQHPRTVGFARIHANALDALGRREEAAAVRKQFNLPAPATR